MVYHNCLNILLEAQWEPLHCSLLRPLFPMTKRADPHKRHMGYKVSFTLLREKEWLDSLMSMKIIFD